MKKYVKELGECLNKRDWTLLDSFIESHKNMYGAEYLLAWRYSKDIVKILTYCKCVEARTDLEKATYEYAKELRENHGLL